MNRFFSKAEVEAIPTGYDVIKDDLLKSLILAQPALLTECAKCGINVLHELVQYNKITLDFTKYVDATCTGTDIDNTISRVHTKTLLHDYVISLEYSYMTPATEWVYDNDKQINYKNITQKPCVKILVGEKADALGLVAGTAPIIY